MELHICTRLPLNRLHFCIHVYKVIYLPVFDLYIAEKKEKEDKKVKDIKLACLQYAGSLGQICRSTTYGINICMCVPVY